jgi:hypothetical protein
MSYELVGNLNEVCTCEAICPCLEDQVPDGGGCAFSWVLHFERGTVEGLDVSGLRMGIFGSFEGNPTAAQMRVAMFMDERATEQQQDALLRAFTGKLGGPLAELAELVGEVVAVERARIDLDVFQGTGRYRIGNLATAELQGFATPDGKPTMLTDTPLSPLLGSPIYPGKAVAHEVDAPRLGFRFKGTASMQSHFHYVSH